MVYSIAQIEGYSLPLASISEQRCTHKHTAKQAEPSTHLHLVTVEEVDVGFVLVLVLTHQQQHGGVTCLIQDRLAQVDGGEREVLQLLLRVHDSGIVRGLQPLCYKLS